MILIIDNYDSFTYNIAQYYQEFGEDLKVVRNNELTKYAGSLLWQGDQG